MAERRALLEAVLTGVVVGTVLALAITLGMLAVALLLLTSGVGRA